MQVRLSVSGRDRIVLILRLCNLVALWRGRQVSNIRLADESSSGRIELSRAIMAMVWIVGLTRIMAVFRPF